MSESARTDPASRMLLWSRTQRWKNDAIYLGARTALDLAKVLPRSWLAPIGSALGMIAYVLFRGARRTTLANLALVESAGACDLVAAERAEQQALAGQAAAVFRCLGRNLTDTVALLDPTEEPGRTLRVPEDSRRVLEDALSEGRGVVYATCHLGPWERMAALLARLGYPISTLARESYDPRFQEFVYERLRTGRNVEVIYRGDPRAPIAIVRALRRGRVLGFLVDLPSRRAAADSARRASRQDQPVRWLGCHSRIALGPARLALRTGSPLVVGTPAPGTRGLEIRISRVSTHGLAPGEASETLLCQRIADELSDRIRQLPSHWPWMHPSFHEPSLLRPKA